MSLYRPSTDPGPSDGLSLEVWSTLWVTAAFRERLSSSHEVAGESLPKSLWNAEARQEVLDRLARLEPDAVPLWGRMSAPQMLAHLLDWMRMSTGELETAPRNLFLRYPLVKQLAIYWLPFPKGVPTAPELITRAAGDWPAEHAAICRQVELFDELNSRTVWPVHPAFGTLTPRAWGVLGYRHMDHHLRQFGV